MDCGPQCLSIVCSYYGLHPDFEVLREMCGVSKQGVSMFHLKQASEQLGFEARVLSVTIDAIEKNLLFPCIAFVDGGHFIVIESFQKEKLNIADPAVGTECLTITDFKKRFYCGDDERGYVLELKATERLKTIKENKSQHSMLSLLSYLRPYKKEIFIVLLSLAIACVAQMILPVLTQKIVDVGIGTKSVSALAIILAGELMLVFSTTIATYIQAWVVMFVGARINVTLVYKILEKLVRLPMHFFDSRRSGDILTRVSDQYKIENFLTHSSIEITINCLTLIVFSSMALYYSWIAFIILITGNIIYILWTLHFLPLRKSLDYETFQNQSNSQDCIIETISGMPEIKLNNYYPKKSKSWLSIQKRTYQTIVASTKLNQKQDSGAVLISEMVNVMILFFAAYQVIHGQISLGVMLALQYIAGQMSAPIQNSVGLIHGVQDASIAYERQQDIINQKEEIDPTKQYQDLDELQGDIVLSDVFFSYEGSLSPSLNNLNLIIPIHKVTAIVGSSGSGKTTLIKMLLGFYKPTDGQILINGVDLKELNINTWRENCGAVLQEGFIFSDTITENIIQNCPYDKELFEKVTSMTNVKDFVKKLPLGYKTKIGENGHGLSIGQKQRILIARAIYKNPDFLLFDEATNALDAKNEQEIWTRLMKSFSGKTVLISAHRLSTIHWADQIVVLKHGEAIEYGNHDELMKKKGEYYKLVNAQLS